MLNLGFLALAFLGAAGAGQDGASGDLKLALSADKPEYVLGDEIQVEATLTNGSDRGIEIAEVQFDERSLSFEITFDAQPGKPKTFVYSVIHPEPYIADRVTLPRVTLKPKGSVVSLYRIPTLKTGPVVIAAVYKGAPKEVKSAPVTLKVIPQGDGNSRLAAILDTTQGSIQIDLLPEEAPNNVSNFVTLARRGLYNGRIFHRVIKNSWVQTGCPYDDGYGGPGYAVKSEAETEGPAAVHEPGTVSMSGNMKSNYTGSQFFICLARLPSFDKKFTVIGKVKESSLEAVRKIAAVDVDKNTDRPLKLEDVRLKDVKIVVVK
jgi:cyclophilin family peptidyl-prolyl cis-trans isomerase